MKSEPKPRKIADGEGLFMLVNLNGPKLWLVPARSKSSRKLVLY